MHNHRSTDVDKAVRLLNEIARVFSELSWTSYQYLDEGWDHEVIILDDELVFRFPTTQDYRRALSVEIDVLAYLNGRVAVAIPEYKYVAPQKDFGGYPKIPGVQLSAECFGALPDSERSEVARQLASFLSAIHIEDSTQPVFSKVSASYLAADQKEVRTQVDKNLKDYLSSQDMDIVAEIIHEVDGLIGQKLPRVFIHNDVYGRHLLWDEAKRQLGIIDFSDMSIDDPAIDFAELHEYGFDFVREVYRLYTGPKDETFLERAWTYQKWTAVYMMTDHFDSHKTSFGEAKMTFDRVKRQLSSMST